MFGLDLVGDVIAALVVGFFLAFARRVLSRRGVLLAVTAAAAVAGLAFAVASALGEQAVLGAAVLSFLAVLLLLAVLLAGLAGAYEAGHDWLAEVETWTYAGPLFKHELADDDEPEGGVADLLDRIPRGW